MGLMMNEKNAQEAKKRLPYKIVDRNGACAVEIAGKVYTPQEISAKVLMKLKNLELCLLYFTIAMIIN